jgi:hypothetical protein
LLSVVPGITANAKSISKPRPNIPKPIFVAIRTPTAKSLDLVRREAMSPLGSRNPTLVLSVDYPLRILKKVPSLLRDAPLRDAKALPDLMQHPCLHRFISGAGAPFPWRAGRTRGPTFSQVSKRKSNVSGRLFSPVLQEPEDVHRGFIVYSRRQYTEPGCNAPVNPVPICNSGAGSYSPSLTGRAPLAFKQALYASLKVCRSRCSSSNSSLISG